MQKTLGGDRLGSGSKLKVHLHNYERSTHDLGYLWRSTMSAGTLVPFLCEVGLPGDTFDINLDCDIKTHPTIGPLFGSYKVQLDTFLIPIRLYQAYLHNNKLGIGMNMQQIKLPIVELFGKKYDANYDGDLDNSQVNPSCLFAYLGIRGIGAVDDAHSATKQHRYFNAVPFLAYWEIYKNYYANKQEEIGAVIHTTITVEQTVDSIEITTDGGTPVTLPQNTGTTPITLNSTSYFKINYTGTPPDLSSIVVWLNNSFLQVNLQTLLYPTTDTGTYIEGYFNDSLFANDSINYWIYFNGQQVDLVVPPKVVTFPLENIDTMRELILKHNTFDAFQVNDGLETFIPPYNLVTEVTVFSGTPNVYQGAWQYTQEGLALKTYQSDIFNNWLNTEWIDGVGGINEITSVDTSSGSFELDSLILAKKVYDMLNRIAVSGGSYDDWIDAVYTHDRYTRIESPVYCGGLIKELVFQEVISNSQSSEGQPLGTLAGKGILSKKHKGGYVHIRVDEPSYIMGIVSLTPRIDYSQGNRWDVNLFSIDDLHKPALDEIGFQELVTEYMAWWTTYYDDTQNIWIQQSAGKQPAWLNYMTNYNRVYGNFAIASNEMFMTLNRRYESKRKNTYLFDIKDLTTYIDPSKFNNIFAETSLDAQNFWTQIAVDITARRKMSAKIMPNL